MSFDNKAYQKEYYRKNREKMRAQQKQYQLKNLDRFRISNRRWAKANSEKISLKGRRYYATVKEKHNAQMRKWWKDHPEKVWLYNARKRALKAGASLDEVAAILRWEKTWRRSASVKCHWCGRENHGSSCHADHVIALSRGGLHSLSNLVVAYASCNTRKSDKPLELWLKLIKRSL